MAHVQDTWYRTVVDAATGKQIREKTGLHGKGQRYRVRYLDPDGVERSKSFPDRQKKAADDFLVSTENDKRRGTYINPNAGTLCFRAYAEAWLESQTFEESSREVIAVRLRKNVFPHLGGYTLAALSPTHIRTWDREMQKRGLAPSYRQVMFFHVQTILNAAVDDEKIRKNPCKASSVHKPQIPSRKVKPWSLEWVHAVHDALPERHQIMVPLGAGLGLRQGEVFGLAVDDIDFLGKTIHVVRQVKVVWGQLCFGPPKRGKTRDVPLPDSVGLALAQHIERYPPVAVALPWQGADWRTSGRAFDYLHQGPHSARPGRLQPVDVETGPVPGWRAAQPGERLSRTAAFLRLDAARRRRDDHCLGCLPRPLRPRFHLADLYAPYAI